MKIKYSNPQNAQPWPKTRLPKRRLVTIYPPVRLVCEPKKTKEEKDTQNSGRLAIRPEHPQTPTLSDQNQTLHGGYPAVCTYIFQVWLRRCVGRKWPFPVIFGQWLIQQLVLHTVQLSRDKHNRPKQDLKTFFYYC